VRKQEKSPLLNKRTLTYFLVALQVPEVSNTCSSFTHPAVALFNIDTTFH